MKKGMKILVAYDGSEPSKHAVNQGASLAQLTESEITIISVVPIILIPVLQDKILDEESISAREMTNYQQQMSEHYSKSLKSVVDEIVGRYPELKLTSKLLDGKPSSIIVDFAEEYNFDLIIIGSRGIGGIPGWILGSTSRRVVESCRIPVIVVK